MSEHSGHEHIRDEDLFGEPVTGELREHREHLHRDAGGDVDRYFDLVRERAVRVLGEREAERRRAGRAA